MKKLNKASVNIQFLNFLSGLLMAFWLAVDRTFFPIAIWIWLGLWLLEGNFKSKYAIVKRHKHYIIILGLSAVFLLLHLLGILYSENVSRAWTDVQIKLTLFIFPVVMLGLNSYYRKYPHAMLVAFFIGNVVASVFALAFGYINNPGDVSVGLQRLGSIHHTYYSMYLNFSIVFGLYALENNLYHIRKIYWGGAIMFLSIMVWLADSRSGILILSCILLGWGGYKISLNKKFVKWLVGFAGGGVILLFILVFKSGHYDSLLHSFQHFSYYKEQNFTADKVPVRVKIWNSSFDVIEQNWIIGTGTGDVRDDLSNSYKKYGYTNCYESNFNAHNQYIEIFMKLGIFGFIILLLLIFVPLYYAIKNKLYLLIFFIIMVAIYWTIESMLCRLIGVAFYAMFYNYLIFNFYLLPPVKPSRLNG
jgi:O-antigen ligase